MHGAGQELHVQTENRLCFLDLRDVFVLHESQFGHCNFLVALFVRLILRSAYYTDDEGHLFKKPECLVLLILLRILQLA